MLPPPPPPDGGVGGLFTFTILVEDAELPAPSITVYTTEYAPAIAVFTVLTSVIFEVIFPSTSSVAVAPTSVYTPPTNSESGFEPKIVITGNVISGTATTLTTLVDVDVFN